jgi:phytoene dehydrogenase-like protein
MKHIVIIGAGMGGLTAAVRLARQNFEVSVIEARPAAGGLASAFEVDGFRFDYGPYILLDRPGLEWAFLAAGLDLAQLVQLRRIEDIYQVTSGDATIRFHASTAETAAGLDRTWPGSGAHYIRYVKAMSTIYGRLRPMLERSHPRVRDLIRDGAWKQIPFLLQSLGSVLSSVPLPPPVKEAIAIWTHVAGQSVREAPSPMAFVSSLIHHPGCFYPVEGIGAIPHVLSQVACSLGVHFRFGTKVRRICGKDGCVSGVETDQGEFIAADSIISNHSGVGTHLDLVGATPRSVRQQLSQLPLQSPGVCAYLALKGEPQPPYLRFLLTEESRCRLLIAPAVLDPTLCRNGWHPVRLLGPLDYTEAERIGETGQRKYLDRLLAEIWWREDVREFRVLATRVPAQWGAEFHLYRNSMNPVMTARFMRAGRLPHRSPFLRGLYLAGASTHPGQWVSFCGMSGIHAANCLIEDLA